MNKLDKINKEIKRLEKELERLYLLKQNVNGDAVEVCRKCMTKNYIWNIDDSWCCGFC